MWNGGRRKNSRSSQSKICPSMRFRVACIGSSNWTTPLSLDALNSVASYPNNKRIRALRPCVRPETTVCSREAANSRKAINVYVYRSRECTCRV